MPSAKVAAGPTVMKVSASQPRFTKDMDLFIQADTENAKAIYAALAEFGAPLQGIRPDDFTDRNNFFRFGREPKGFDILPAIPGVDFDAAWERPLESSLTRQH